MNKLNFLMFSTFALLGGAVSFCTQEQAAQSALSAYNQNLKEIETRYRKGAEYVDSADTLRSQRKQFEDEVIKAAKKFIEEFAGITGNTPHPSVLQPPELLLPYDSYVNFVIDALEGKHARAKKALEENMSEGINNPFASSEQIAQAQEQREQLEDPYRKKKIPIEKLLGWESGPRVQHQKTILHELLQQLAQQPRKRSKSPQRPPAAAQPPAHDDEMEEKGARRRVSIHPLVAPEEPAERRAEPAPQDPQPFVDAAQKLITNFYKNPTGAMVSRALAFILTVASVKLLVLPIFSIGSPGITKQSRNITALAAATALVAMKIIGDRERSYLEQIKNGIAITVLTADAKRGLEEGRKPLISLLEFLDDRDFDAAVKLVLEAPNEKNFVIPQDDATRLQIIQTKTKDFIEHLVRRSPKSVEFLIYEEE